MNMPLVPGAGPLARLLPGHRAEEDARIRQAAWVARCVGRGEAAPLRPEDVTALAGALRVREFTPGQVAFRAGDAAAGVWIIREGRIMSASRQTRPGSAAYRAGWACGPRL